MFSALMDVFDSFEGVLLGLGHPLLDIIADVDNKFLEKYQLKPDDSIRANELHRQLYEELTSKYRCQYIAGGSVQNSLRTVQWMLNKPKCMTFMGAIGDDHFGRVLSAKISEQGVNFISLLDKTTGTGTSACLISDAGKCRSLIAYLGASQNIRIDHLLNNYQYIEMAKVFYTSGYHLAIDPESVTHLAKHANNHTGKLFCLNLSAPYVSQMVPKSLLDVFPYVDILFGNEAEAQAFAHLNGWQTTNVSEIAKLTANMPSNRSDGRTVIYTQGNRCVLVAKTDCTHVIEFPVPVLDESKIIDTIGAGDAFVGGFFTQLVQNKQIDVCVKSGIYAAQQVIQQIGCQFPRDMRFNC
ncbi:adenosine kinase-like [Oppia nitens]|uniref:adenosine kinase-like n=1 Tax=Oppia nitens TaxID=1686743 RepID=UPI0023DC5F8D|nr:adenosine kinase-like [Oppia nitens]